MPCNAAPSPEFSREDMDAVEIYYKAEIDRVTRVACNAIKVLRRNALYDSLSQESKAWSHQHDAWDAARRLVERTVKATVRRSTFDDKGNEIDYGDESTVNENDIAQLRSHFEDAADLTVDVELSRQAYEDMTLEWTEEQQEGDDSLDEAMLDEGEVLE